MDADYLRRFEELCVQDEPPPCQSWCPVHLDARALSSLVAAGKLKDARKLLNHFLPLSGLTGYLCEAPCRVHCRREELDKGVDLSLVERMLVIQSRPPKIMSLPASGHRIAVFGSDLSSLVVAAELARKGHQVVIHYRGAIGGSLNSLSPEQLPDSALEEAISQLMALKVIFQEAPLVVQDLVTQAQAEYNALFFGLDDPQVTAAWLGLAAEELRTEELTLGMKYDRCFASPDPDRMVRFIDRITVGKRAAGSIDRLVQGVSPASSRGHEDVYPSRLYTNLEGYSARPPRPPANSLRPTPEEGRSEADRCIQCQCLECAKHCVYLRSFKTYPRKAAREIYNNISTAFGVRTANTMINTCAECGLCSAVCPTGVDLGAFCAAAKKDMVAGRHMPASAHEFALQDMEFSNSPEVSFWRPQPERPSIRWMFFPGCQLPAALPGPTRSAYEYLTRHLPDGVGFHFACCGAPARWSGRPRLTRKASDQILTIWQESGQPTYILSCASCQSFFQVELPKVKVTSVWEVLDQLPLPPTIISGPQMALHDPCPTRDDESVQKCVRSLLSKLGQSWEEPPMSGPLTRCCGYGGLADQINGGPGWQYAADRIKDVDLPFISYCVMCRDRFLKTNRPSLHLYQLLFAVDKREPSLSDNATGISDKQENRLAFSLQMRKELWAEQLEGHNEEESIILDMTNETAALLDKRRILRTDITAVLLNALKTGAQFINIQNGHHLACYRPRQVTFWVEYTPRQDRGFEIHRAWCHRMVVQGVPGPGQDSPATLEGYDSTGGRV